MSGAVPRFRSVGVAGCGLMGSGIAEVCAAAGFPTVVYEPTEQLLEAGLRRLRGSVDRSVEREKRAATEAHDLLELVDGCATIESLAECDLIIEAITEQLAPKQELFSRLSGASARTIFASNTSSLSITEMAVATDRPERFVGLHFFNPVPAMALVEVVDTPVSDAGVVASVQAFAQQLGKTPVRVQDRTGFIVNRLLVPYLLEAVRALEQGLASVEDVDAAMRLGCGYPMGPFTLLDYVGLDTTLHIAGIMYEEFKQPQFAPPPLLRRMVLAGHLGRKSGRGFYSYER